jgi:hypothetical protein
MTEKATNFLHLFKTDKENEEKGIEIAVLDSIFIVKRAGRSNKTFTMAMANYHKKNKFQIENDMLSEDKVTPDMAKIYFDTVSIGWRNVRDPKTEEVLEHTKENFIKVMCDYPEFFDFYREQCQLRTNFVEKENLADSKN